MNILVCISKAPDTTSKIAFTDGNTKFDENGVQFIVNPYDEWYALVRGIELKEANGGSVTTITVGGADADPIIRKALAIGADKAVRIDAAEGDPGSVAAQIAAYAKDQGFDMILTGKETINYNGGVVGGMIAEHLDLPYISLATKLDMNGGVAEISREVQGGVEVVEVDGPFVLSAAKGMAEQRIPNMRGIMAARTKPLEVVPAADVASNTAISTYALPEEKGDCTYVDADNPAELVRLLNEEAKVL
ncbi:electron transfer flavoprotein subunit beta/FixA family protein [Sanyastnella coralliicola]|uniref:electron transfer flavoprotein subunit beta/FixA family protein n=1 Tax=Sanyastnella coralliicola TaxID=3069118 RepID=UPI0027BA3308|nr:electron transfer flavoprotein subunit beta/FixA family protein [Longitalea sp. SCSIO 12813]